MKKWIIIVVLILVLGATGWYFLSKDTPQDEPMDTSETIDEKPTKAYTKVEFFAQESSSFGVGLETQFRLEFDGDVSEAEVKDKLAVSPEFTYELIKQDDRSFAVKPTTSLAPNTIYSITYDNLKYGKAFQTVDDIRVVQSYPGNGAMNVPYRSVVELVFNTEGIEDISGFFNITPEVEGAFDYQENKVVFRPEKLQKNTHYEIAITPGLVVGNREMKEAYTFDFTTGSGGSFNWDISYGVVDVQENRSPIVALNTWNPEETYQVKIIEAKDFQTYLESFKLFKENHEHLDQEGYELVFEDQLESFQTDFGNSFLTLPGMMAGRYIAMIEGEGLEQYVFLQVDNHQIYYAQATNGELFWVVNADQQVPAIDARIIGDGEVLGTTNADGVLIVNENLEKTYDQFVVQADSKSYIVDNEGNNPYYYYDFYYSPQSEYWSFIYSDRRAYTENDTVNVFGFARAFDDQPVDHLELVLTNYWAEAPLMTMPVTLNSDMSFTSQLQLEDQAYGYYQLKLMNGEEIVSRTEIMVMDYEKPEVYLESDIKEDILFAGETLHYTLKAKYFNELPYSGMKVAINTYNNDQANQFYTTDETGTITLETKPSDKDDYWYPNQYEIYAYNESVEDTYVSTRAYTTVMPRDTMILTASEVEGDMASVTVDTYLIDLSQYNGNFGTNYENIRGQGVERSFQVQIKDTYYEKIFVETKYDPIHKLNYDVYRYERREATLPTVDFSTENGSGMFEFGVEKDHYYHLILTTTDSQGRVTKASSYVGTEVHRWLDYSEKYTIESQYETYDIGDTVYKRILSYNEPIEDSPSDFALHLILRNGILAYQLSEKAELSFQFQKEYRPNVMTKSIYFDGESMTILPKYNSLLIGYDYETLEGEIKAKTDKDDYAPGEEVTVQLEVKRADGTPFNGAVNVSVVDEAFFALFEDYFNLGSSLHAYIYNDGILKETVSSDENADMAGAEAGEGGDDSFIRDEFEDTAYFETVEIVEGKGQVTFELPDNLTSWRLTLHGVNENLEYASATDNIYVGLPYFVRGLYNTKYLTGDEVYLAAKSDGESLSEGEAISYTAKLLVDGELQESYAADVETKGLTQLYIGKLDSGDYQVQLIGQTDEFKDGMEEPLVVRDTYEYFNHRRNGPLTLDYQLINDNADTILYLYNEKARQYQNQIYNSYRYDNERTEEIVARFGANQLLKQLTDDFVSETFDLSYLQDYSGGIRFLKTSDPSVETTALIAGTKYGMEYFNKEDVVGYLKDQLENDALTIKDKAMILWGLSAQDEPVLLLLDELLDSHAFESLDVSAQLYTLLALEEMKDWTRLLEYSEDFFTANLNLNEQENTLAATLSLKLNTYQELFNIDTINQRTHDTIGLQNIYYMMHVPTTFKTAKAVINMEGDLQNYPLPDLSAEKLVIPAGANFKIESIEGGVYATEVFEVNGLQYNRYQSDVVTLEKEYMAEVIHPGDMVEVRLSYTKPALGFAVIHDNIPAGFEYAGPINQKEYNRFVYISNQDIYAYTYAQGQSGSLGYYIRAVQKGTYHTDPAYIQQYYEGELDMTTPITIEVE